MPLSYCINGVRLLRLCGTDAERAILHGDEIAKLSKEERRTLATHPLAAKNQYLLKRAILSNAVIPPFAKNALVAATVKIYEEAVVRHHRRLDDKYTSRIEAFARHSHLSPKELIFALYQPDFLMVLAALANDSAKTHFLSGIPGCSSAVVRTGNDGALTLLRNLDYPAAGHWEKWPTVFFHEPSETSHHAYVSVGSLGIHLAGLTGVNESGVAFSLHAHFSKKFSLRGVPIFFLGQEIMESAHSIDEAIFLCKRFRTIGSWAINLASHRENRTVTVELSHGKSFVRESPVSDGVHAHSNGFQCQEFRHEELHFNGSFFEDVEARKCSLEKSLAKSSLPFRMDQALAALASHEDFQTGVARIFGNTVSVVTTIQSLGMDLQRGEIHLSQRKETPTPLGPFLTIPMKWDQVAAAAARPDVTSISPSFPLPSGFMDALHCYYQAYCSWHVTNDAAPIALEHLIRATGFLASDPHLQMQRGYFELLLARTPGHYRAALQCFDLALSEKMSIHHEQVGRYFRGASLDLLGRRSEAIEEYQTLASAEKADPKLRGRAAKRLKIPYESAYCQKIVPDLQFVEPLEYL